MYDLLQGLRVLDFSQYWPEAVGQYFSDLGAEVIKVEPARFGSLTRGMGDPDLPNLDHMHWSRGKQSFAVDLKQPEGRAAYLALAETAAFVIDGLRSGALDKLGVGYEDIQAVNPTVVYVGLSGWGNSGPYRRLATHGMGFDAFCGFRPPVSREDGLVDLPMDLPEMAAAFGCLYAIQAGLAAYIRMLRTGQGAHVDVSEGEAGAAYFYRDIDDVLNPAFVRPRPTDKVRTRYQYYSTKDGKVIVFQAIERKFWENFCRAVDRPDLLGPAPPEGVLVLFGTEEERQELAKIFGTRTQAEWVEFFIAHDIAGGPRNDLEDLVDDPHFQGRQALVDYADPELGTLRQLGTPVKVAGQTFSVGPAPEHGEHTAAILGELGFSDDQIADLADRGVVRVARPNAATTA